MVKEDIMEEKQFYAVLEEGKIVSFLTDEIHSVEVINKTKENGCIIINEELWQYLLSLGQAEFNGEIEERTYTIEDKELFSRVVIPPVDLGITPPTTEERLVAMESLLKEMVLSEGVS